MIALFSEKLLEVSFQFDVFSNKVGGQIDDTSNSTFSMDW